MKTYLVKTKISIGRGTVRYQNELGNVEYQVEGSFF